MSQRLLIAIGDPELASAAAALASEGDDLEVVERVSDPEELARTLRRLDVDVVALHDALGTVAGDGARARDRDELPRGRDGAAGRRARRRS